MTDMLTDFDCESRHSIIVDSKNGSQDISTVEEDMRWNFETESFIAPDVTGTLDTYIPRPFVLMSGLSC